MCVNAGWVRGWVVRLCVSVFVCVRIVCVKYTPLCHSISRTHTKSVYVRVRVCACVCACVKAVKSTSVCVKFA